ncbi:kinase-like domain-containing protein [Rhizophagus irregularis DAOM 181602=DAOM 197198]|nr:kinase-like domain-containing protein [Rhizophagus irregularis DAOM 181602=DAOM 197198]
MSADYLNELKTHWKLNCLQDDSLKFYGISKDPETEEIIMIMQYADGEVVKAVFEEADKEIPNISTSNEKKPDAIYTSRAFTFSNLSKPINSSFIATTYLNEEDNEGCQDSQLINLEVPSTSRLEDGDSIN